nr:MAG: replication associated protein [Cressdnaviricota sp.]
MSQLSQPVSMKEGNTKTLSNRIRSRRWCYTLNNYTVEQKSQLFTLFSKEKYFIQGEEIGESGTHHLQGYVEFKNQKDLNFLKKINNKIHWEKSKGNRQANTDYCSKDDKFEEKKEENFEMMCDRLRNQCLADSNRRSSIPMDVVQAWIDYSPERYWSRN